MEYFWDGNRIEDVRAWAKETGQQMLTIEKKWQGVPLCGKPIEMKELIQMPTWFWGSLRFDGKYSMKVIKAEDL